jgi:hypothetical protein
LWLSDADTDTDSDEQLIVEPAPSNDEDVDMGPPQIVMSSSDVVVESIENGTVVLILWVLCFYLYVLFLQLKQILQH